MTITKFYKTKFKPAFNAYMRAMKKDGTNAVASSYHICALKELNAWLEELTSCLERQSNNDVYEVTALTAIDGKTFIKAFLAWFNTADGASGIFSPSAANSVGLEAFWDGFIEAWARG